MESALHEESSGSKIERRWIVERGGAVNHLERRRHLCIVLAQLAWNVALGVEDAPHVDVVVLVPVDDQKGKAP